MTYAKNINNASNRYSIALHSSWYVRSNSRAFIDEVITHSGYLDNLAYYDLLRLPKFLMFKLLL